MLPHAPGVQVQAIPEDAVNDESDDEDKVDKDERLPQSDKDKRIVPDNEFSDSEDEGEGGRRDNRSYKGQRKRQRLDKTEGETKPEVKDEKDVKSEYRIHQHPIDHQRNNSHPPLPVETNETDGETKSSDDAKKEPAVVAW